MQCQCVPFSRSLPVTRHSKTGHLSVTPPSGAPQKSPNALLALL